MVESQPPATSAPPPSTDIEVNTSAAVNGSDFDWSRLTANVPLGDSGSCQHFYDAFFDLMHRDARRLIGPDEHACLDIVHDAMIKSMRSMKPMAEYAQIKCWVRLVVKSVAYDWLRKRARTNARSIDAMAEIPATTSNGFDTSDARAKLIWLAEQIEQAPPTLRRMLSMRFRVGLTLQQIASKFNLKPGAVDGRIRRAVEQLRLKAKIEFPDE